MRFVSCTCFENLNLATAVIAVVLVMVAIVVLITAEVVAGRAGRSIWLNSDEKVNPYKPGVPQNFSINIQYTKSR